MITKVILPKLGETMEEANISKWFKQEGEEVKKGEPLFEITTDKASIEVESPASGILRKIVYHPSESSVNVLEVVGIISENPNEPIDEETLSQKKPISTIESSSITGDGHITPQMTKIEEKTVKASPMARKMCKEMGIDISALRGTGPEGRITEKDVWDYQSKWEKVPSESIEVSPTRKIIAERVAKSMKNAPHFYLTMEVNMDKAIRLKEEIHLKENLKVSFNDIIIKAVAVALKNFPYLNGSFEGEKIRLKKEMNIGFAVATEEGLSVPVIKNADNKSITEISKETNELIELAKQNKISLSDMETGTFTISNLGMYGVDSFTAVINPPQAGILSVGTIKESAVVLAGQLAVAPMMKITLSADHRMADGAYGALFLKEVKNLLENPEQLK